MSILTWAAAILGGTATLAASVNGIAGRLHERKDVARFEAVQQHIEDHVSAALLSHVDAHHGTPEG